MPADQTGRRLMVVVVAAAVCCGAAALLVGTGVLAAGARLFGSPELTVAAAVVAVVGMWRLAGGDSPDEELMWSATTRW